MFQGQGERLKHLGAIDRVEHPGPADRGGGIPVPEIVVHTNQVSQEHGVGVWDRLGADVAEETGHRLLLRVGHT